MLVFGTYGAGESFFTLKGEVEAILNGLRIPKATYTAVKDNPSYHPGRCAKLTVEGADVGYLGQIHPLVAQNYGIDTDVYCAELNFSKLFELMLPEPTFTPLPRFPSVARDIAVVCDETVTVGALEDVITSAGGKLLQSVALFDIYRGNPIPEGKKSVAFSLELRAADRTLTDADSEQTVKNILSALESRLGAVLR